MQQDEATLFQLWLAHDVPHHLHEHHDRAFSLWEQRIIDQLPAHIGEPYEAFKRKREEAAQGWALPGAGMIYPLLSIGAWMLPPGASPLGWAVPALSATQTVWKGYKLYCGVRSLLW